MIRCLAIDDEKLVLELLEDNIHKVSFLQLIKSCKNALEANEILQQDHIDLIFLDIQMPGLNGLQFLQTLSNPPMVILVTAYEQYALEGYNLNVVDYLLKPVSFERFLKACNKAQELYNLHQQKNTDIPDINIDYCFVYVEYNLVKVVFEEILFIEAMKDYVKIFTNNSEKHIMTRMNLKAMEDKLPVNKFIRINKSYIVAANKITAVKRDIVCIGQKEFTLSNAYKESLNKVINRP